MRVRAKKKAPAWKGREVQPAQAQHYTFPAPVRGWIQNENLLAVQPGGASRLDNWICTTAGARVRGGALRHATAGDDVLSLMTYRTNTEQLFAATSSAIYDVSAPADPAVAPTADVTGLTSGDYAYTQYGTAGGDYLLAVNGADDLQMYDGATWTAIDSASSPAITGVATSDLSHVWAYGQRIWFVEKDSLNIWYLPADSIAGAATQFSLAGIFSEGGKVLFGARWSLDAGDGLDDVCVFMSDQGEVAVYEGTDPGSASTWRKVGVYRLPRPLGKRALVQAGGDLLIATETGLIPLSSALKTDLGAMETIAVSRSINPYWLQQASSLSAKGWEIQKDEKAGVMVVSQPDPTGGSAYCLFVNLTTGAWSRATGWDTQCLAVFQGRTYFGSLGGGIFLADETGSDDGGAYVATYIGQFDFLGQYGVQKTTKQMRPLFKFSTAIAPLVTSLADYNTALPPTPSIAAEGDAEVWDSGLWDQATWDASVQKQITARWYSAAATGATIAPAIQLAFQNTRKPDVEMVAIDAEFFSGAMVA